MTKNTVFALGGVLVVGCALFWFLDSSARGPEDVDPSGAGRDPIGTTARGGDPQAGRGSAADARGPDRVALDVGSPSDVPAARRVTLLCRDAQSRAPLRGVLAWNTKSRRNVGQSDDHGRLVLDGASSGQCILHGDGYLATLLPAELQVLLREKKSADVLVYSDRYSIPLDIVAEWPRGVSPMPFQFWLRPSQRVVEGAGFPTARLGMGAHVPLPLQRAWEQHRALVGQFESGVVWHLERQLLPHQAPGDRPLRVRLTDAIDYELRAHTNTGLVGRGHVRVKARGENIAHIVFAAGLGLEVVVTSQGGAPIEGAFVRAFHRGDPGLPSPDARTDAGGVARLVGFSGGQSIRVEARAPGFEDAATDVEVQPKTPAKIQLRAIATAEHVAVVRELGSHKPLAGVVALLGDPAEPSMRATSDAKGRVRLRVPKRGQHVLTLQLKGYVDRQELLDADSRSLPADFDLLPADRSKQRKLRLICIVRGQVQRAGKPLANATVLLSPWVDAKGRPAADAMSVDGLRPIGAHAPHRTVLRGDRPEASLHTITDADGRFELCATSPGRALLMAVRGKFVIKREVFLQLGKLLEMDLR